MRSPGQGEVALQIDHALAAEEGTGGRLGISASIATKGIAVVNGGKASRHIQVQVAQACQLNGGLCLSVLTDTRCKIHFVFLRKICRPLDKG